MENSANLELPYILPSQAQKHVTHNEALSILDALVQLSVVASTVAAPPGSPAEGQRWIVPSGATDAWAGQTNKIAAWQDSAWLFMTPRQGWIAYDISATKLLAFDGAAWVDAINIGIANITTLGVNTTPDASTRLAVKSNGVTFSHDDVTPGTGDMQVAVNKATVGNTVSLLFQTDRQGHAEFGLAGDDNFHVKVSADGQTWKEALVIDRGTGSVTMPHTIGTATKILAAEGTTGTSMANNTYTDQIWDITTRNDFGTGTWNGTAFTAPEAGVYDISAVLSCNIGGGSPTQTDMYFNKNGSAQLGFMKITNGSAQNTVLSRVVVALAAGATISVRMRQNSGLTQTGLAAATFSVVKVG